MCAVHCVQLLHTIQHTTDLIIFPLALQTITIALMMSIWGKGGSQFTKEWQKENQQTLQSLPQFYVQLSFWSYSCLTQSPKRGPLGTLYRLNYIPKAPTASENTLWPYPFFSHQPTPDVGDATVFTCFSATNTHHYSRCDYFTYNTVALKPHVTVTRCS